MPTDIKITTELLRQGALVFALMDAVFVPLLMWRVKRETFRRLRWPLILAAALVWFGIWSWAIGNFWETVYSYVFPAWGRLWIPIIAFVVAAMVAASLWSGVMRMGGYPILNYCLLGGALGSLTHIWAVYRGIVTKPPMLQGASPLAAVILAFFEYMFYWCAILTLAAFLGWAGGKFKRE
ncbi:MAG: hypothetical protein AB1750_01320 [Chloroflexota bacterium]